MFKLDPDPTFDIPVRGFVPGKPLDGLRVVFRYKDADALKAWFGDGKRLILDMLAEVIDTWRDAPVEYGPAAIETIAKKYPAFPSALIETYRREMLEAATKN